MCRPESTSRLCLSVTFPKRVTRVERVVVSPCSTQRKGVGEKDGSFWLDQKAALCRIQKYNLPLNALPGLWEISTFAMWAS